MLRNITFSLQAQTTDFPGLKRKTGCLYKQPVSFKEDLFGYNLLGELE
jgi:hypothetical protein